MKQTSITFQAGDITLILAATRNPVSLKFTETLSIDMKGFPVVCHDTLDLGVQPVSTRLTTPKTLHRLLKVFATALPMELKEAPGFGRDWGTILRNLLSASRQEQHQCAIEEYQHALLFKYEQHPNIAVKNRGIVLTLHKTPTSLVTIRFIKGNNRRVTVHGNFIIQEDSASYTRYEGNITSAVAFQHQVNTWTNAFEKRCAPSPAMMKQIRDDIKSHLAEMSECVSDILERIRHGKTI